MSIQDTAFQFDSIEKQIRELEDKQIAIMEQVANYKVTFGKYKGKTLAEIAHKNSKYYNWIKVNNLIPFTFNFKIDMHVRTKIQNRIDFELVADYQRKKDEQGYVGRYII